MQCNRSAASTGGWGVRGGTQAHDGREEGREGGGGTMGATWDLKNTESSPPAVPTPHKPRPGTAPEQRRQQPPRHNAGQSGDIVRGRAGMHSCECTAARGVPARPAPKKNGAGSGNTHAHPTGHPLREARAGSAHVHKRPPRLLFTARVQTGLSSTQQHSRLGDARGAGTRKQAADCACPAPLVAPHERLDAGRVTHMGRSSRSGSSRKPSHSSRPLGFAAVTRAVNSRRDGVSLPSPGDVAMQRALT